MISWMTTLSNFDNLASSKQGSPLTKCACLSKGLLHISKMIVFPAPQPLSPVHKLSQPTDMMEWLQRLRSAKSSPGPGASTPIDENKSVEKNILSAEKSPPCSEISSFSQAKASVAAMKITRSRFLKFFLETEGCIQELLCTFTFHIKEGQEAFLPQHPYCLAIVFPINVVVIFALIKFVCSPEKLLLNSKRKP